MKTETLALWLHAATAVTTIVAGQYLLRQHWLLASALGLYAFLLRRFPDWSGLLTGSAALASGYWSLSRHFWLTCFSFCAAIALYASADEEHKDRLNAAAGQLRASIATATGGGGVAPAGAAGIEAGSGSAQQQAAMPPPSAPPGPLAKQPQPLQQQDQGQAGGEDTGEGAPRLSSQAAGPGPQRKQLKKQQQGSQKTWVGASGPTTSSSPSKAQQQGSGISFDTNPSTGLEGGQTSSSDSGTMMRTGTDTSRAAGDNVSSGFSRGESGSGGGSMMASSGSTPIEGGGSGSGAGQASSLAEAPGLVVANIDSGIEH